MFYFFPKLAPDEGNTAGKYYSLLKLYEDIKYEEFITARNKSRNPEIEVTESEVARKKEVVDKLIVLIEKIEPVFEWFNRVMVFSIIACVILLLTFGLLSAITATIISGVLYISLLGMIIYWKLVITKSVDYVFDIVEKYAESIK